MFFPVGQHVFPSATGRRWLVWAAVLAIFLILPPFIPAARALVGDTGGDFGLDGSIRAVGAFFKNYNYEPVFGQDDEDAFFQTILRLNAAGRPAEAFSYEFHLVGDFDYDSRATSTGFFSNGRQKSRYRVTDEKWAWRDEGYTRGDVWPDRLNAKIALPFADVTVGRQAITFGKAWFWNPLDVFLPFDPSQFDRDYKSGVDGLRVDLPLGNFSGITLVAVGGRELGLDGRYVRGEQSWQADWYGSAALARVYTSQGGWDLALQGGKIYGGHQLGGALVGEVHEVQLRLETAYFWADAGPRLLWPYQGEVFEDHLVLVAGAGRHFGTGLDLNLEFLYNDGGEDEDLTLGFQRLGYGAIPHAGRFLAGLQVSYEITPLHLGSVAAIHSFSDDSTQIQPTLTWSLTDDADLVLGAGFHLGRRPTGRPPFEPVALQSEFGTYPDMYFAEIKWYF